MCGGGCNTSSSTTAPSAQASSAYTDVVGKAQAVANTPYQPYQGQLVAGLGTVQNKAIDQLAGVYGAAQPYIDQGSGYLGQAAAGFGNVGQYMQAGSQALGGVKPYQDLAQGAYGKMEAGLGNVGQYLDRANGYFDKADGLATPQDFTGADGVSKYMSPYTSAVIDTTMARARQENAAQTAGLVSNAIGSGAYGGDRNGIAVATLAGQQALANDQTIAGLNDANYRQASAQFNTTQDQRARAAGVYAGLGQGGLQAGGLQLSTAQGYGQAGAGYAGLGSLQGQVAQGFGNLGQLQGQTAQGFGTLGGQAANLGSTAQANLISGASAGLQAGTVRQQNRQQQDTAAYNQYMAGLSYPYQNVGFLSNIVQGIGSQQGNTTTTQGNALSSIAGLGTSAIGILGATGGFGANGYLTGMLSASDERVKEDIAPIGRTFDGQTIHRYRYKGDPEVRTGLLAQEVAERDPGAVGHMGGGVLGVDYDRATAGAARMGLGDVGRFAGGDTYQGLGTPLSLAGEGASPASLGFGLAARMARAAGGPVPGFGALAAMQPGAMPGLGTPSPFAARPRFFDGGGVDPAPIPSAGLDTSPAGLVRGVGLDTSPAALMGGSTATARPGQGAGTRPPGLGAVATPPQGDGPAAGFGNVGSYGGGNGPAPGFGGADASSARQGGGMNQNAWMGVLAAGLGMMGGTSASATANIGRGALEGLQMYQGLQQRDAQNAFKDRELAIDKQRADQTAAYQDRTFKLDQSKVDLSSKQLELAIQEAQRSAQIQSGQLANQTANTQSEVEARKAATAAARYSRTFIPGQGWMVTDLTDPTKPPQMVPVAGQDMPAASAPQGATSAPPSGGTSLVPVPRQSGADDAVAPARAGVGAGWKPTTTVPQGYVPPNQTGIYMNPGVLKGEQATAAKTIEGTRAEAQAAGSLQMRLDEMDHQFAQLPQTGLLAPGQGAEARASLAKTVNQYATGIGMQPIFDPNAVAANENLLKDRFRLGAELSRSIGGREPGFIVQQAVKANPGADNTPMAYRRITAGLRQAAQYQQDRSSFFDDYNAKFGHLNGAQQAFDKANPPQAYANRAVISTIDPRDVADLQQKARNPAVAAAIDRKYGPGASAAILGQ